MRRRGLRRGEGVKPGWTSSQSSLPRFPIEASALVAAGFRSLREHSCRMQSHCERRSHSAAASWARDPSQARLCGRKLQPTRGAEGGHGALPWSATVALAVLTRRPSYWAAASLAYPASVSAGGYISVVSFGRRPAEMLSRRFEFRGRIVRRRVTVRMGSDEDC